AEVMQWLFWQMGGLGPMLGQNHHFRSYSNEKITYAIERYTKETDRLYGVLSLDRPARAPGHEPERVSPSQALVRGHSKASGRGARLRARQASESRHARHDRRGEEDSFRPGAAEGVKALSAEGRAPSRFRTETTLILRCW